MILLWTNKNKGILILFINFWLWSTFILKPQCGSFVNSDLVLYVCASAISHFKYLSKVFSFLRMQLYGSELSLAGVLYAHHITASTPGFENLTTSLRYVVAHFWAVYCGLKHRLCGLKNILFLLSMYVTGANCKATLCTDYLLTYTRSTRTTRIYLDRRVLRPNVPAWDILLLWMI